MFQPVLAYGFSSLILLGALGVVLFRKPVYSVLSLIFAFLNASALYILLGAEFVALSTVIIYVGAVSVLLLFVVMTLTQTDERFVLSKLKPYRYWIFGMGAIFVAELILLLQVPQSSRVSDHDVSNIKSIGRVLYTQYGLIFQCCAVVLLVAMVSAVIVTFQSRSVKHVKRQNSTDQINRKPEDVLQMVKVKRGEGI
ncbi:NADH-quinone oxidoreductase subunit J [Candidatus Bodocaedibacter vickermanii]|uniref:NADH-quinone oxidoreductase subunit J n=1 Tax=Candidatus Bodocaedibacter vickermanii TaxID=2741701 RepID=A0A7L9RTI5_9PROT|nr:NADH-quinone oxidoreductase subunit J [Candidatus Paracaedibacteraceae bacterium 'Lake Konstanz']